MNIRKQKSVSILLVFLLVGILLIGCSSQANNDSQPNTVANSKYEIQQSVIDKIKCQVEIYNTAPKYPEGDFRNYPSGNRTPGVETFVFDCWEYEITKEDSIRIINYWNHSETDVQIPDEIDSRSVRVLGSGSLSHHIKLENVYLPSTLTHIESHAFYRCYSLQSIYIPNNVLYIGDHAFFRCVSLTSINVENTNACYSDHEGVLYDKWQSELLIYPEGKTSKRYALPCTVQVIGQSVPGYSIFGYTNYSLEEIYIPSSVKKIDGYPFFRCNSLKTITVNPTSEYFSDIDGVLFNYEQTELITYPLAKEQTSYTVPKTIQCIDDYAFGFNINHLNELVVYSTVTEFPDHDIFDFALVMIVDQNSMAEQYAIKYRINYKYIKEE